MSPKTLNFIFGRFNPPTLGHKKLFDAAAEIAGKDGFRIYPSKTTDKKKNPVPYEAKLEFLKKMFPQYNEYFIDDERVRTALDVLVIAEEEGYSCVNMIVGSDRKESFENLLNKYNGELYSLKEIHVISGNQRNDNSSGIDGLSASKMRDAVSRNDYQFFLNGIPNELTETDKKELFNAVARGMELEGY